MPKVSVIIPNYNHAKYLERRIMSVLNQTYQDYEIIIIDDASTDDSRNIISRFRNDQRFKIILNSINSGSVFKQWTKGIENANGTYIWIAESDDEAEPELLETLVGKLDRSKSLVLAYCQSVIIDSEGKVSNPMTWYTDDLDRNKWSRDYTNNGHDELSKYLVVKNTIPNASAVVFKRAFFPKDTASNDLKLCGDWLIWSRMLLHGDIYFCAKPMNYFRCHSGTVRSSTSVEMMQKEFIFVTRDILSNNRLTCEEKTLIWDKLNTYWSSILSHQYNINILPYIYTLLMLSPTKCFRQLFMLSPRKTINYFRLIAFYCWRIMLSNIFNKR